MVQRRSKATGRKTPILTPPAEVLTLRELQDSLHRSIEATSTVDPLAVAVSLADFGRAVEDNDIVSANRPVFTIATALFAALRAIRQPYPYFSSPASQLLGQPVAAEILAARADGVLADEFVAIHRAEVAEDPARRLERLRPLVVSMLAESAIFQGELISRLGSALVLTGLAGFRDLAAAPDHTNSLFQRNIGLTAYDYVLVLLALYAHSLADPLISMPNFIQEGPRKEQLTRETTKVVTALARRADRFFDLSDDPQMAAYTGKALPSAVFQRWPLIQLNEHKFLVSAHPFLKVQLTSKFLTKALTFARREAPPEQQGRTAYSAFVGLERFEPFVRELCDLWCPGRHFGEYEYLRSGNQRSADRIVFERHGNRSEVAVLLQVKLKMVLEATHFGATADALARDLGSALSETVYKSAQFLAALERAHDSDNLKPEFDSLSRRILGARYFCLVGIVPEIPPLFTMSDVRQLLLKNARAELSERDQRWLDDNQHRIVWHVLGLDELLLFLELPERERDLFKRLSSYLRNAGPDRPFIDQHGRVPMSFRSYLATKYQRHMGQSRVGLFETVQRVMDDVNRYFSQPSIEP